MLYLRPGELVRLKSGGPLMTITEYDALKDINKVKCSWFEGTSRLTETFHRDELTDPKSNPTLKRWSRCFGQLWVQQNIRGTKTISVISSKPSRQYKH